MQGREEGGAEGEVWKGTEKCGGTKGRTNVAELGYCGHPPAIPKSSGCC